MFKIKVADIVINYAPAHTEFFEHRLKKYLYNGPEKGIDIEYCLKDKIELPEHTVLGEYEKAQLGKTLGGNSISYFKTKAGRVVNYKEHNPDYTYNYSSIIKIPPTKEIPLTDCDREYLSSGEMFNDRLVYEGGTCLHGSCIAYKGQGVVFSAPCGTGKSTHTNLWEKLFKEDVEFLNDDKPALREKNQKIYAYGTPWSGKTDKNSNISVPLKAVVFIKRSEQNKIYKLSTAEAVCYLNDQTFPTVHDQLLKVKNLDFIEKIIKTVPIYMLECNVSENAVLLARNTIFEREQKNEN